jgi:predicted HicB family RNase H-like nuclease
MEAASVSINLRLPRDLHARLKDQAARDRRSLNAEIVWLLDGALDDIETRFAGD